jgi:tripartite-type tricarboxylate transporter receptor subunit TctC
LKFVKARRHALGAIWAMAVTAAIPFATNAQSADRTPITIISPTAPGGVNDFFARLISEPMSRDTGRPVIVKNVAGANGIIGATQVARAEPDGSTLLMSSIGTQVMNQFLYKELPYSPTDLVPVALVATYPYVFVVNTNLGVKTLGELVALAKSKPDTLNFGSPGIGSGGHIVGTIFNNRNGIRMAHVPYTGSSRLVIALLSDQVQFAVDNFKNNGEYIRAGKLQGLAVTGSKRSPKFPDIPTVAELGYPEMEVGVWYGVFAPKGTPDSVVQALNREIGKIVESPEYQERAVNEGFDAIDDKTYKTPAQFQAFVLKENEKWGPMVHASGAHAD